MQEQKVKSIDTVRDFQDVLREFHENIPVEYKELRDQVSQFLDMLNAALSDLQKLHSFFCSFVNSFFNLYHDYAHTNVESLFKKYQTLHAAAKGFKKILNKNPVIIEAKQKAFDEKMEKQKQGMQKEREIKKSALKKKILQLEAQEKESREKFEQARNKKILQTRKILSVVESELSEMLSKSKEKVERRWWNFVPFGKFFAKKFFENSYKDYKKELVTARKNQQKYKLAKSSFDYVKNEFCNVKRLEVAQQDFNCLTQNLCNEFKSTLEAVDEWGEKFQKNQSELISAKNELEVVKRNIATMNHKVESSNRRSPSPVGSD